MLSILGPSPAISPCQSPCAIAAQQTDYPEEMQQPVPNRFDLLPLEVGILS
jgi:hypothetical protein